jgi:hypothetical protein
LAARPALHEQPELALVNLGLNFKAALLVLQIGVDHLLTAGLKMHASCHTKCRHVSTTVLCILACCWKLRFLLKVASHVVWCGMVWYGVVWCGVGLMVWHGMVRHGMIWHVTGRPWSMWYVAGYTYIYIYVCSAWFLNVCVHIFSVRAKALSVSFSFRLNFKRFFSVSVAFLLRSFTASLSLLSPTFLFRFHHFSSISPPFIFRFFFGPFGLVWYSMVL